VVLKSGRAGVYSVAVLRFLPNASAEMSDTGVSEPAAGAQTVLIEQKHVGLKV
jgi:hypothetical protein